MGLFDRLRGGPRQAVEQKTLEWDAPVARTYLTGTGRDFDGLEENDQPVKFHVSEPVRQALDEISGHYESNLSVVVRHILFVELYGTYDLIARAERGDREFLPYKAMMPDMVPRFSLQESLDMAQASPPPPDLGKNNDNIKVWLPVRMVADIDQLARRAEISRSVWIRRSLIRHLFGQIQLPEDT